MKKTKWQVWAQDYYEITAKKKIAFSSLIVIQSSDNGEAELREKGGQKLCDVTVVKKYGYNFIEIFPSEVEKYNIVKKFLLSRGVRGGYATQKEKDHLKWPFRFALANPVQF